MGEAQGTYPKRLKLWRRTIELRHWLSLCIQDRIESVRADAKIDWLLHTQGVWKGSGKSFTGAGWWDRAAAPPIAGFPARPGAALDHCSCLC